METAEEVWLRLTECYGQQFVNQFGSVPTQLWVDSLAILRPYQVSYALGMVSKNCPDYPPSLAKFMKFASDAPRPYDPKEYAALPPPDYSRSRQRLREVVKSLGIHLSADRETKKAE